jgi:hypothetical protein
MKPVTQSFRTLVAAFCLVALTVPGARAASILLDAGNIEELVTFTFSQFEGGFSINGSTPTSGGSFTFGEGTQLNFTGQWIDLGAAVSSTRTVYWVDEDPGLNIISEILQWTITPSGASGLATISGFFQAEGLGTLPPGVPSSDIIFEYTDGSHDPFQFSAPFLAGQVITGAGDVVRVPEPGILALFGFGLAGLGWSRRKKA